MSSFKNLFEKAKFTKAGEGYVESFLKYGPAEKSLRTFISSVESFIVNSEEHAKEEGVSIKEQQEMIIDDILNYLDAKLK